MNKSELIYDSIDCSIATLSMHKIHNCRDGAFYLIVETAEYCIECVGLRGKNIIFSIKHITEDYAKKCMN